VGNLRPWFTGCARYPFYLFDLPTDYLLKLGNLIINREMDGSPPSNKNWKEIVQIIFKRFILIIIISFQKPYVIRVIDRLILFLHICGNNLFGVQT
jgi:hypothetical protein